MHAGSAPQKYKWVSKRANVPATGGEGGYVICQELEGTVCGGTTTSILFLVVVYVLLFFRAKINPRKNPCCPPPWESTRGNTRIIMTLHTVYHAPRLATMKFVWEHWTRLPLFIFLFDYWANEIGCSQRENVGYCSRLCSHFLFTWSVRLRIFSVIAVFFFNLFYYYFYL